MIKVLLADDQPLVRAGLRMILQTEADIEIVGEAATGEEAVDACARQPVDVVLMDVRMPGLDGIEATRQLTETRHPPHILILTTFDLDDVVYEALRAGASGFLLKDASEERLTTAIRVVADGGALFAPTVTRRLIREFSSRAPCSAKTQPRDTHRPRNPGPLTHRPRADHAEIAATLFITENTVKTHVARILSKLSLRDRAQAVVIAYESGLITAGD